MKKTIGILIALVVLAAGAALAIRHNGDEDNEGVVTPPKSIHDISYSCKDGKTIHAILNDGVTAPPATPDGPPIPGGIADITLSDGRTMTLHQTISADGVRYANADESFVFWTKGTGALVLENNQEKSYIGCAEATSNPQ